MKKRPLIYITALYVAGILLGEWIAFPLAILLLFSLAVAGATFLFSKARFYLLWPLVFLTGLSNNALHRAVISPYDLRVDFSDAPQLITMQGTLRATPKEKLFVWEDEETWRSVAELEVSAFRRKGEWQPAVGDVFVTTPDRLTTKFHKGQIVQVTGVISRPRGPLAEGLFDYRTFLQRKGIYFQLKTGSTNDWVRVSAEHELPISDRFIASTKKILSIGIPEDETTHLLWTLVLDWKAVFTDEEEEPFMRAGTYHIFAVDGLRITIVSWILLSFLRLFGVPRAICGAIIIALIWFYTGVTDFPASAIRASIMMTIIIGSWILKRPGDLMNSLFIGAMIILLWRPQQLFQAGFQLSFFVVLCIALLMPVMELLKARILNSDPFLPDKLRPGWRQYLDRPIRYFVDVLMSSWAAWIGSIPLSAYYFHLFTPVSTPANLLVVPLTVLTLISCLMSLLLGWFPWAAAFFNHASWSLMKSITWLSQWSVRWPGTFCYVATPSLLTIGTFYLFLLTLHTAWFWKTKRKLPVIIVLVTAAVLWIGFEWNQRQFTRIHVLPLKGGHAVFVEAAEAKESMLIDCGDEASAEFVVKPFLRAHGVNRLPQLLVTHGDLRYMGGAEIISTNFNPKEFIFSPVRARSSAYRQFVDQKKNSGKTVRTISAGERLGVWSVLHPASGEQFPQADDNAIALKGRFGTMDLLLGSDLGLKGQRALLSRASDLKATIVVSGLPRQEEPLSTDFIRAIGPQVVMITDSDSPATERSSEKLRQRLSGKGYEVIYGRERGSAVIEVESLGYHIQTINPPAN
jgi:competence protein ComEC